MDHLEIVKQAIYNAGTRLTRSAYRELLDDIIEEANARLDALELDEDDEAAAMEGDDA